MLRVGVLVSGGGTNLQAILDAIDNKTITNAQVAVVISNNRNAYALERARNHGICLLYTSLVYGALSFFEREKKYILSQIDVYKRQASMIFPWRRQSMH